MAHVKRGLVKISKHKVLVTVILIWLTTADTKCETPERCYVDYSVNNRNSKSKFLSVHTQNDNLGNFLLHLSVFVPHVTTVHTWPERKMVQPLMASLTARDELRKMQKNSTTCSVDVLNTGQE